MASYSPVFTLHCNLCYITEYCIQIGKLFMQKIHIFKYTVNFTYSFFLLFFLDKPQRRERITPAFDNAGKSK